MYHLAYFSVGKSLVFCGLQLKIPKFERGLHGLNYLFQYSRSRLYNYYPSSILMVISSRRKFSITEEMVQQRRFSAVSYLTFGKVNSENFSFMLEHYL